MESNIMEINVLESNVMEINVLESNVMESNVMESNVMESNVVRVKPVEGNKQDKNFFLNINFPLLCSHYIYKWTKCTDKY